LPKAQVNSSHITGITALFISDLPNASSKLTNHFAQRKQNRFWTLEFATKTVALQTIEMLMEIKCF
jgi:hypothetical protein